LLQARGSRTVALENDEDNEARPGCPNTYIESLDRAPPDLEYWLADGTGIYPLRVGINTIGRSHENDVVVENAFVSRRHCAILVHAGDGCDLHDTASKNGTYLNGQKLNGPTRLKCGDEIRMCNLSLIFVARSASPENLSHPATLRQDIAQ
jgi:pSer/pThr/pTyr-binding forkhead associated (FHA) protein